MDISAGTVMSSLLFLISTQAISETVKEDNLFDLFGMPLTQCIASSDEAIRLACFDKEARKFLEHYQSKNQLNRVRVAPKKLDKTEQKQTNILKSLGEGATKAEKNDLHLAQDFAPLKKENRKLLTSLLVVLVAIDKTKNGKWILTTSGQQVWRQTDNQRINLKEGQKVQISKGSLGSFFLKTETQNKRIRVKRIL